MVLANKDLVPHRLLFLFAYYNMDITQTFVSNLLFKHCIYIVYTYVCDIF